MIKILWLFLFKESLPFRYTYLIMNEIILSEICLKIMSELKLGDGIMIPSNSLYTSFFFLSLFIYFERPCEHQLGRGREMGRERIPSKRHVVNMKPDVGLELTNREIMTWVEIQSDNQLTKPPRHPYSLCTSTCFWFV